MLTTEVVINVIMGQVSVGVLSTVAYALSWSHPCGFMEISPSAMFLNTPLMAHLIKISLSFLFLTEVTQTQIDKHGMYSLIIGYWE